MKNLLDHKKPIFWTFWITVILIVVLLIVGTITIANFNKQKSEEITDVSIKGLELYIWRYPELTGNDNIYFTLLQGTNRNKTEEEIYDMNIATTELSEINDMLKNYTDTEVIISIVERKEGVNAEQEVVNLEELDSIVDQIIFPNETQNKKLLTDEEELARIKGEILTILDVICSSPKELSAPKDYIALHQDEYDEILSYEYMALPALVSVLDERQFDLRENIAYALCTDILVEYMPFTNIIDAELILFTQEARQATKEWLEEYSK